MSSLGRSTGQLRNFHIDDEAIDDLRTWIDWASKVEKCEEMSRQFLTVITQLKSDCEKAIILEKTSRDGSISEESPWHRFSSGRSYGDGSHSEGSHSEGSIREDIIFPVKDFFEETIRALEAAATSRWYNEQGLDGLCQALIDSIDAMREVRMRIEYGDHLAHHLKAINQQEMHDCMWKIAAKGARGDWQKAAEHLNEEKEELEKWKEGPISSPRPETPWRTSVEKAARIKRLDDKQVLYEIEAYAQRNKSFHIEIENKVNDCDWRGLGKRILYDKSTVPEVFKHRERDRKLMWATIERYEKQWFTDLLAYDDGTVVFELTDGANKKQRAFFAGVKSRGTQP